MLDQVDLKTKIDKEVYEDVFPQLALGMRRLQWDARQAGLPVLIVLEGWEIAGMDDAIAKLSEALDPRHVKVHPIFEPSEEERMRPFLWRHWIRTPAKGEIAVFDQSWYRYLLRGKLDKTLKPAEWATAVREINAYERQLAEDGTLILKYFFHISRKEQRRRFEEFESDPYERWRVTKSAWQKYKHYDKISEVYEEILENTSTAHVPWEIIPANFRFFRRVKLFEHLTRRLNEAIPAYEKRKQHPAPKPEKSTKASKLLTKVPVILDRVDLTVSLEEKEYEERLKKAQVRLRELLFECYDVRMPVIATFEGWDAAGKGGTIKRLLTNLDPRSYEVHAIAAPTDEEKAHHYLWRFWKRLPKAGHLGIFDRTWYGRVLVERVEGFCSEEEWKRAYREINEFEHSFTDYGTVLCKYWLHISKEEQLRRFQEREKNVFKQYKLTDEDWRNRERWDLYRLAVADMLEHTSTTAAPWTIVESDDKKWGRVKVIETLNTAIARRLKRKKKSRKK